MVGNQNRVARENRCRKENLCYDCERSLNELESKWCLNCKAKPITLKIARELIEAALDDLIESHNTGQEAGERMVYNATRNIFRVRDSYLK